MLAAKDERSQEEEVKLQQFKEKLRELMFPKGKTLIERVVEREYYSDLKQRIKEFNKIMESQ